MTGTTYYSIFVVDKWGSDPTYIKNSNMTYKEALKYIKGRFEYESELCSYAQDFTEDGVFTLSHLREFDEDTTIDIAEDLRYQFKCEFGHLLG